MRSILAISSRGVITLPAKLRRELGLNPDDQLIAEVTTEGLLLRPAVTMPVEVYSAAREREFDAGEAELASALSRGPRRRAAAASTKAKR